MSRRKPKLNVTRLDDRIAPSASVAPDFILPPDYWRTSQFLPTQATPADDGGTWVVGTTQTAGRYAWWGYGNNDWAVVKLTAAGTIDPAFNGGKVKDLTARPLEWFRLLETETGPDGKLYVLARNTSHDVYALAAGANSPGILPPPPRRGNAPEETFAVVRFNGDGSLDATFDADGIALLDLDPRTDQPLWGGSFDAHLAVGADGRAVVASARSEFGLTPGVVTLDVVRLTDAGALDTTFDADGRATVTVPFGNRPEPTPSGRLLGVGLEADGDVVLGGQLNDYQYYFPGDGTVNATGFFAARLTSTGKLDATFDGDGVATYGDSNFGDSNGIGINDFALASDGGLLFAGTKFPAQNPLALFRYPQTNEAFVARLTESGTLDPSFDGDGILYPKFRPETIVTSGDRLTPLPGGGFAFAGHEMLTPPTPELVLYPYDFAANVAIVKYAADGSLDSTFAPVRRSSPGYGSVLDLDATTDRGLLAVTGYPSQLLDIDATGTTVTPIAIPYGRRGPWQPPPEFVPFPRQPVFRSATGDFNGDGVDDYVYVTGLGSETAIRIVDGQTGADLVVDFKPYEARFRGGMFVAAADFDGDGRDDLVVSPDDGGSARVQVFRYDGTALVQTSNFFAIEDPNFRGGGSIAVADVNGDGTPDLVVGAAKGGSQRIATFDGKHLHGRATLPPVLFGDYFAPIPGVDPLVYRGGVTIESRDVDGDGVNEVVLFPAARNLGIALYGQSGQSLRFRALPNGVTPEGPDLFVSWER